jgi:hypothetical protein
LSDAIDEALMMMDQQQKFSQASNNSTGSTDTTATAQIPAHAVVRFSQRRAGDAKALVTLSRNLDRPGKRFYLNFLLPIILDGIFHKLAPAIFGPNIFGMLQRPGIGFRQIQRRKRLDRALQIMMLGSLLSGIGLAVQALVGGLSKVTGRSRAVVMLTMMTLAGTVFAVATVQKAVTSSRKKAETSS